MKKWKIFVTFFKKLYDHHYTIDKALDLKNFTFVKVNDEYEIEIDGRLDYDIFIEHDFRIYDPELQKKGYHENSVLYHLYKNENYKKYDYIGFIEYDHVLSERFCETIQTKLDETEDDLIFAFNKFTFAQLWDQGILLNPNRPKKQEGNPKSKWNCVRVILNDYNEFFGTEYTLEDLKEKDCFPICHAVLMPSKIFEKIMAFHTFIIESGRVEPFHSFNWRSNAGLMERYLAVELALEEAKMVDSIQLEHRAYDVKVVRPEWLEMSSFKKFRHYLKNLIHR